MKHVFISRESSSVGALAAHCQSNNIRFTAQPLIHFERVDAKLPSLGYSVVFFTSPRSVEFYLDQCSPPNGVLFATIGQPTSEALEARGLKASFIGEKSTDPEQVAADFQQWLGDRVVVIPQSNRSNKTIERALNQAQVIPLVVYTTITRPQRIDPVPDVVILSSPSNAEAFFELNTPSSGQRYIAYGATTAAYLKEKHGIIARIPRRIHVEDLLTEVLSLE
jgi:uroporphyrinogen-III synthase